MSRLTRNVVFRHTLIYVGLFVLSEVIIFAALYGSTILLYEQRAELFIHGEIEALESELSGLDNSMMAIIITKRCNDEPGEFDEYLLASSDYRYIAGNIRKWPDGLNVKPTLTDLALGRAANGEIELHRARAITLPDGQHLLVGLNLTEFEKIRTNIGLAMLRILALTLLIGFGGGFLLSMVISRRLERINANSRAILDGDLSRRIPLTGSGDEFDALALNLNRMLDKINTLIQRTRDVTDDIAHDMRKPISRLRTRIEVTLMGREDTGGYREALERTIEEADEILALFNSLLTIAMAESGGSQDRFKTVNLSEVVESIAEVYGPAAEEAGLRLNLQIDAEVAIPGNNRLITQALANLLDNAILYAPDSGPLTIAINRDGETAVITVADRGPGIPASFRDRAMERFSRLDDSRTGEGSGLGLSLVRAVAHLHNGTVVLGDQQPGLIVTLRLPARRAGNHPE